ncbi:HlyU family transcriptional regulator [Reinekea marinisedimentorum]|uniref:Transcriptional activator HlyU n=1 Tax=Reinekea marinisedimentorum TaxID=230495 RepID=A0A4R3IEG0_9GAMM|nr:HlyU family transcriptional regulator [Reinekea marinisedimentorum]TCS43988.1 hypothetical protein BCF53_101331 [Reinekea marinisedimentorum]
MFGWFKKASAKPEKKDWEDYQGFRVCATPIAEGGQYRVSGIIEKGEGEDKQQHTFVRADLIAGKDEAKQFTVMKAKLMIDQLGDRVFKS